MPATIKETSASTKEKMQLVICDNDFEFLLDQNGTQTLRNKVIPTFKITCTRKPPFGEAAIDPESSMTGSAQVAFLRWIMARLEHAPATS